MPCRPSWDIVVSHHDARLQNLPGPIVPKIRKFGRNFLSMINAAEAPITHPILPHDLPA
jgi:hypothetical protein